MEYFFDKTSYTVEDVQSLIENEVEESVHLEFKASGALDKADKKREEIAKDVSAFANSDGGVIVYGLVEQNNKAHALDFIDGEVYSKEWLEQVIRSNVQRPIPALIIHPVRQDGSINKTLYVVKIPSSIDAPHMSKDKRFYKRNNFESVRMEEYEVRNLYGRKSKSKLALSLATIKKSLIADPGTTEYVLEVQVMNISSVPEAEYTVCAYFFGHKDLTLSYDSKYENYEHSDLLLEGDDEVRTKISAASRRTLFEREVNTILRMTLKVPSDRVAEVLVGAKIRIGLMYGNGTEFWDREIGASLLEDHYVVFGGPRDGDD